MEEGGTVWHEDASICGLCSLSDLPLLPPVVLVSLSAWRRGVCPFGSEDVCMETHHRLHGSSTSGEDVWKSEYVGPSRASSSRSAGVWSRWGQERESPQPLCFGGGEAPC